MVKLIKIIVSVGKSLSKGAFVHGKRKVEDF
jgi:hypothetical protein